MRRYILNDLRGVVLSDDIDLRQWDEWYGKIENRRVGRVETADTTISTVFLGYDHGWVEGAAPLVFETMVWRNGEEVSCERCSTWSQAEDMHKTACETWGVAPTPHP